jgi:hypothetical protein
MINQLERRWRAACLAQARPNQNVQSNRHRPALIRQHVSDALEQYL